jgi:hypothetical protein
MTTINRGTVVEWSLLLLGIMIGHGRIACIDHTTEDSQHLL